MISLLITVDFGDVDTGGIVSISIYPDDYQDLLNSEGQYQFPSACLNGGRFLQDLSANFSGTLH